MVIVALLIGVIPSIGFLLDVWFVDKQKFIYDKFIDWWDVLSEFNVTEVIKRGIGKSGELDQKIFSKRIFGARSIFLGGVLICLLSCGAELLDTAQGALTLESRIVASVMLSLVNLAPGLMSFLLTRSLVAMAAKQRRFNTVLTLGLLDLLLVDRIVFFFWWVVGGLTAFTIKLLYLHHWSSADAISGTLAVFVLSEHYSRLILNIALFPTYVHLLVVLSLVALSLFGKICECFKKVLQMTVDARGAKAFTSIGTCISAVLVVGNFICSLVPVREVACEFADVQGQTAPMAMEFGIRIIGRQIMDVTHDNALLQYIKDVAHGVALYASNEKTDAGQRAIDFLKKAKQHRDHWTGASSQGRVVLSERKPTVTGTGG